MKKTTSKKKAPMYCYEVDTDRGAIDVDARNRAQARKRAEALGFQVYSINMVGHY